MVSTEYQEYFLGGIGGRSLGLTTLPPSCADCLEIWKSQRPGTFGACSDLHKDCFILRVLCNILPVVHTMTKETCVTDVMNIQGRSTGFAKETSYTNMHCVMSTTIITLILTAEKPSKFAVPPNL
jgi:hypothetical protein